MDINQIKVGDKVKALTGDRAGRTGEVVKVNPNVYRAVTVDFGTAWVYSFPIHELELAN